MEPDGRFESTSGKCFVRRENGRVISQSALRCFYTGLWRHPCRNTIIQIWLINAGRFCYLQNYRNNILSVGSKSHAGLAWLTIIQCTLPRDSVRLFLKRGLSDRSSKGKSGVDYSGLTRSIWREPVEGIDVLPNKTYVSVCSWLSAWFTICVRTSTIRVSWPHYSDQPFIRSILINSHRDHVCITAE